MGEQQQVAQPALGPLKSLEQAKKASPSAQQQHQEQELKLADIHLPATPSAWPPAPGWWILLAFMMTLITLVIVKFLRYQKLKTQQQRTLQSLTLLENKLLKGDEDTKIEALAEINILLRRLALMHYSRKNIASLTGKSWLSFLDKSGSTQDFSQGAGRILADAPYLAKIPDSVDIKGLTQAVKKWVEQISIRQINNKNMNRKRIKA